MPFCLTTVNALWQLLRSKTPHTVCTWTGYLFLNFHYLFVISHELLTSNTPHTQPNVLQELMLIELHVNQRTLQLPVQHL